MNSISVVIPVYNEAKILHSFLMYLQEMNSKNIMEFLVVDGQSTDDSKAIVLEFSKKYTKFKGIDSPKGRAVQMNTAAAQAKGTILYFLHADSLPPKEFDAHILKAVGNQFKSGCFRMKFDSPHWGLKIAGWLTQLNWKSCRGGDQSLFIEKNLFEQVGGYDGIHMPGGILWHARRQTFPTGLGHPRGDHDIHEAARRRRLPRRQAPRV